MQGFQTLLRGCKAQLGDARFSSVKYGFDWENSIPLKWAMWNIGMRIGFVISTIFSLGLTVPVFLYKVPE
jgi:hypothetical protein